MKNRLNDYTNCNYPNCFIKNIPIEKTFQKIKKIDIEHDKQLEIDFWKKYKNLRGFDLNDDLDESNYQNEFDNDFNYNTLYNGIYESFSNKPRNIFIIVLIIIVLLVITIYFLKKINKI